MEYFLATQSTEITERGDGSKAMRQHSLTGLFAAQSKSLKAPLFPALWSR